MINSLVDFYDKKKYCELCRWRLSQISINILIFTEIDLERKVSHHEEKKCEDKEEDEILITVEFSSDFPREFLLFH